MDHDLVLGLRQEAAGRGQDPGRSEPVAAIELLLREGLGRPPQAEDAASPRLPRTAEAVEKLSWADMQVIFAAHFASEIAAVTGDSGDVLLRERVAALDDDQRRGLREALDAVAVG